jgi:hypothetical protein
MSELLRSVDHSGSLPVDTRRITAELSKPRDLHAIVQKFDRGETWLRDISGLTSNQRETVLTIGNNNQRTMRRSEYGYFQKAAENLRSGMEDPDNLQRMAGWNFLVNATGFIRANYPWAQGLNACFQKEYGHSIGEITNYFDTQHPEDKGTLHHLVSRVASNPKYTYTIGYYLAGRSEASQQFQETRFGESLDQAKADVEASLPQLAARYGLPESHLNRTLTQLRRTSFSAFDHLLKGVTSHDNNSTGDYVPGTLRVEQKADGSPAMSQIPSKENSRQTLRHEVLHAISAQDEEAVGLMLKDGTGIETNEAMTEYLAQIAGNFPGARRFENGNIAFRCAYDKEVLAMHALQQRNSQAFGTLVNGYFGNPRPDLQSSLNQYYNILNEINRMANS